MKGRKHGVAEQSGSLRERIKALELAAEKCQQDWLATIPTTHKDAPPLVAAALNLAGYVREAGAQSTPALQCDLVRLLHQAFPDAAAKDLSEAQELLAAERSG